MLEQRQIQYFLLGLLTSNMDTFRRKRVKMKELGPAGGSIRWRHPLDPPMWKYFCPKDKHAVAGFLSGIKMQRCYLLPEGFLPFYNVNQLIKNFALHIIK